MNERLNEGRKKQECERKRKYEKKKKQSMCVGKRTGHIDK